MARQARKTSEGPTGATLECVDALLWIGQSYKWVDCGRPQSCAIPFVPVRGDHCFVHEAERRGVSRKIAAVPTWAVPGLTRVFLAHRADQRTADRGRLFGYFVLHRIETLTGDGAPVLPSDVVRARGLASVGNGVLEGFVLRSDTGAPIPKAEVTACRQGDPDGPSYVPTSSDEDGRYRLETKPGEYDLEGWAEGFKRGVVPGVLVVRGRVTKQDLLLEPEREPVDPPHDPPPHEPPHEPPPHEPPHDRGPEPGPGVGGSDGWNGGGDSPEMPITDEALSEHRACSLRLVPGAVYLVDSLAAEVHEAYHAALTDRGLPARAASARGAAEREAIITEGRALFNDEVVKAVHERRAAGGRGPRVPGALVGKVKVRGDLVLFDEPPVVERRPRASFRSVARIAGDDLIGRIVAGESPVRLRFFVEGGKGASLTKSELVAVLAERCGMSLSAAGLLLDTLAELTAEELRGGGKAALRLQHLGTFRWRRSRGEPEHVVFELADELEQLRP